jgi:hypothetical protein
VAWSITREEGKPGTPQASAPRSVEMPTAAGDVLCTGTFVLDRGQITAQGLADSAALFGRGETVPWAIMGGAEIYRNARGDGTVQVPVNVPNQTDANFVLNAVTNS